MQKKSGVTQASRRQALKMRMRGSRWVVALALAAGTGLMTACGERADERPSADHDPEAVELTTASPNAPGEEETPTATGERAPERAESEHSEPERVESEQNEPERVEAERIERIEPIEPRERPERIRGIYLNAWVAGSTARIGQLVELAERSELNTFVIDVKDASGYVSYPTEVGLAREIGADTDLRIGNLRRLLERLREADIYPIARIVVFKDPLLAKSRQDLAVQDSTGATWIDGAGHAWVNPFREEVWDYPIELAREAVELGFAEVQWDYIRFPDRPASEMALAVFPGQRDRTRQEAVRGFLEYAREGLADLDVPLGADVFGVTTTFRHDVGIGQVWEDMVDVVDAILPMIYPSHYWTGSYGFEEPNAFPYEVVARALRDAVDRSAAVEGAAALVPWLQDFTLGSPAYGAAEVRAQIQAAYDQGVEEWILWNAAGRYNEEALLPTGMAAGGDGEASDPLIRLGGRLVPTSRRWDPPEPDVLQQPVPPDPGAGDGPEPAEPPPPP